MIRLYIDNKEVALSESTSFELYRHNVWYDRNGEYTYDIDIDLRHKDNYELYAELANKNAIVEQQNRKAVIYDGAEIVCGGTEVILSIEGYKAKIQVVAGASELNYLIGDDTSVRSLDLGDLGKPTEIDLNDKAFREYPDAKYGYPIFINRSAETRESGVANTAINLHYYQDRAIHLYESFDEDKFAKCPYVLHVVDKVLEALGYNVVENDLVNKAKWKHLVLFNTLKVTAVNKMLPDWSVKKFFEEVENFFNCVFLVKGKNVMIKERSVYVTSNAYKVEDKDLVSSFECKTNEDEDKFFANSNVAVRYNLPSDRFFKYADIPDENMSQLIDFNADFSDVLPTMEAYKQPLVYHDRRDFYFSIAKMDGGSSLYKVQCNQFKGRSGGIELNITPAQVNAERLFASRYGKVYCATVSVADVNKEEEQTVESLIVNGYKEALTERMEVAIFDGMKPFISEDPEKYDLERLFPRCYSSTFILDRLWSTVTDVYEIENNSTLELYGARGRVESDYKANVEVGREKYIFQFFCREVLDPGVIYNISGRRFLCASLKYRYENLKLANIVEGEFYPVIENYDKPVVIVYSYFRDVQVLQEGNKLTFLYSYVRPQSANREGQIAIIVNGVSAPFMPGESINIADDTTVVITYTSNTEGATQQYRTEFKYQEEKFYKEVDFIYCKAANKLGMINTGYFANADDIITVEGDITGYNSRYILGTTGSFYINWNGSATTEAINVFARTAGTTVTALVIPYVKIGTDEIEPIHIIAEMNKLGGSTVNGEIIQSGATNTVKRPTPLFVFNLSQAAVDGEYRKYSSNQCNTFRLQNMQIKDKNGTLLYDFIPVKLLRDLTPEEVDGSTRFFYQKDCYGLYDKIGGKFFGHYFDTDGEMCILGSE